MQSFDYAPIRAARTLLPLLSVALLLISVSGCVSRAPVDYGQDTPVDLLAELRAATQTLLQEPSSINLQRPILTSPLVNIDDLQLSSTFGRQATAVFGSEMARAGVPVIDVALRETVFIQESTGELGLTRELRDLSMAHNAQAVLVGTYSVGTHTVYVNIRLIQPTTRLILTSHNFSLPLNRDIRALLMSP